MPAPAPVTVVLFALVATWNSYFLPLIMLNDQRFDHPPRRAFLFLQRYWQSGLAAGAVKQ
ncbi:hypothetical protein AB0F52_27275 [Amycolatopsis sp. NPDC024027]|uniref:hypothetical protein n=1 Tax=Amycolatopsis sp. NPDC024027 TaxID=3154327 RepID=UPI00340EDD9F